MSRPGPTPPAAPHATPSPGPEDRHRALATLAVELTSDRPLGDMLRVVAERGRALVEASAIVMTRPDDGDWSRLELTTARAADGPAPRPAGTSLLRQICDRRRPLRLTATERASHPAVDDATPAGGWLAVPILGRDGVGLGVVEATHAPGRAFTVSDEAVLVQAAQMAAAVIEDHLLRRQLEARVAELDRSLGVLRRMHDDRRRMLGRLIASQEEERARLAGDLHDDPVQVMTAVSMRLEIVHRYLSPNELPAFERLQQTVAEGIVRMRRMMFELRPLALDDSLASALNYYLDQHDLVDRGSVRVLTDSQPSPAARTILYRIAQEALTAIRRRGGAAPFSVVLSERAGGHLLEVRDDGGAFDEGADRDGLVSMRERAELAGGWFTVEDDAERGAVLRAWVPRDDPPPESLG